MSRTIERIRDMLTHLCAGWHEHLEFAVIIDGVTEKRGRQAYQPALLAQLQRAGAELAGASQGGGNANKPGSRPPGNTAALHLADHIECDARSWYNAWYEEVLCRPVPPQKLPLVQILAESLKIAEKAEETHLWLVQRYSRAVMSWVRRARITLGYDKPEITLKDVVCGECGGTLVVASDASSDVRCTGTDDVTSCGVVYPRYRWLEMMNG